MDIQRHPQYPAGVGSCRSRSGLVSPVLSTENSEAEQEDHAPSPSQCRAVKFQQCPRPSRMERAPKRLRCPTPPVHLSFDDSEDDEEDDQEASDLDDNSDDDVSPEYADRYRRSDSESDDASEVFYCE